MNKNQSIFRSPTPTEPRISLDLPCTVQIMDNSLNADVFNVSYSDIGVVLDADHQDFSWKTLHSVSVPEIGDFEVSIKWKKGCRLGLKFNSKRSARPVLTTYFQKTGNYPV